MMLLKLFSLQKIVLSSCFIFIAVNHVITDQSSIDVKESTSLSLATASHRLFWHFSQHVLQSYESLVSD